MALFQLICQIIFGLVAGILFLIALCTGLSYNEVNIIVHYFIVPVSWLCLLDKIFRMHYLKILSLILLIIFCVWCKDFSAFSNWMFEESVWLLNYCNRFFGDYITSSVVVCVFIPALVYAVLIYIVVRQKRKLAVMNSQKPELLVNIQNGKV
jgi:hypothetical protein